VPATATLNEGDESPAAETWAVPGAAGDDVLGWYDAEVPEGEDRPGGWVWCSSTVRDDSVQRLWTRPGGELTVLVFPEEDPPQILLMAGEAPLGTDRIDCE
jgi:hypothetical protein